MPLLKGKENIGKNISELQSTGRRHEVAVAIALKTAGIQKKPQHKVGGRYEQG